MGDASPKEHSASPLAVEAARTLLESSFTIPHHLFWLYGLWDADFRSPVACDAVIEDDVAFLACLSGAVGADFENVPLFPERAARGIAAWSHRYRDWRHIVVDAHYATLIISHHFPDLLDLYQSLPRNVQRSDVLRVCLLIAYGGIYADLDTSPSVKDLAAFLSENAQKRVFFFEEALLSEGEARAVAQLQPIRNGIPESRQRISNYFFISAPRQEEMDRVLSVIVERCRAHSVISRDYDVLYTTGPDAVTEAVHEIMGWRTDSSDIIDVMTSNNGISTPVRRTNEGGQGGASTVSVVSRPIDQLLFSHDARGTWKT